MNRFNTRLTRRNLYIYIRYLKSENDNTILEDDACFQIIKLNDIK